MSVDGTISGGITVAGAVSVESVRGGSRNTLGQTTLQTGVYASVWMLLCVVIYGIFLLFYAHAMFLLKAVCISLYSCVCVCAGRRRAYMDLPRVCCACATSCVLHARLPAHMYGPVWFASRGCKVSVFPLPTHLSQDVGLPS